MRAYKKYFIFFALLIFAALGIFLPEGLHDYFNASKTIELKQSLFKKNFITSNEYVVRRVKKVKVTTKAENILYADSMKIIEGDKYAQMGNYTLIDLTSGKVSYDSYSSIGWEIYHKAGNIGIKELLGRLKKINKDTGVKTQKDQVFFVTNDGETSEDGTNLHIQFYGKRGKAMVWQEENCYRQQKENFNANKKFVLLDSNHLLTIRKSGSDSEMSVYDLNKGSFTNKVKNNVQNFTLSGDKKKIAYVTTDNNGEEVIYIGEFKNSKIENKWILYKTYGDITDLRWSSDGRKLYLNEKEAPNKSTVYQYLLEE